jgi:hypothetical protein
MWAWWNRTAPRRHVTAARHAGLEQPQEQRQEEQFGLLGLDDALEVLGGVLVVERPGEGRVGQDERVHLLVASVLLGERVLVAHVGLFHAVEQHVHAADAQHGAVEVEAVEHTVVEVAVGVGPEQRLGVVLA